MRRRLRMFRKKLQNPKSNLHGYWPAKFSALLLRRIGIATDN
jgi:hypothetical protein